MDTYELEKMRWSPRSTPSKGPRRICKFLLLGVIFPITLLCIPVYMRFLALRPHALLLSPTDMKLLNQESVVSTAWCRSQRLTMNSSFHAYLFNEKPNIMVKKHRVNIRKKMILEDDKKKYWGFYLLRGSTVRLGGCARWPGSSVVVVRGQKDAARCAWLGELDSQEESDEFSKESDPEEQQLIEEIKHQIMTTLPPEPQNPGNITGLEELLRAVDLLAEDQKNLLYREIRQRSGVNSLPGPDSDIEKYNHRDSILGVNNSREGNNLGTELKSSKLGEENAIDDEYSMATLEDELNRDDDEYDSGGEELDQDDSAFTKHRKQSPVRPTAPDHFAETGNFNQQNNPDNPDRSNEEVRSSFSSSEEALLRCDGVFKVYEFMPHKQCDMVDKTDRSAVLEWYPFENNTNPQLFTINVTGFYYFIFSNENEMTDNTVVVDIELHKTRFNTSHSQDICHNSTDCELHLTFWSNQHVLVEVPEVEDEEAECDSHGYTNFEQCNYVVRAESECIPRGTVYMVFLLLVPVAILLFAYV